MSWLGKENFTTGIRCGTSSQGENLGPTLIEKSVTPDIYKAFREKRWHLEPASMLSGTGALALSGEENGTSLPLHAQVPRACGRWDFSLP